MSDPHTPQALILSKTSLGAILGTAISCTARLGDFQTLLPVMAFPVFFSNSLTTYPGFGSHLASSMSARMWHLLPTSVVVTDNCGECRLIRSFPLQYRSAVRWLATS